jgi:hypothetical protein
MNAQQKPANQVATAAQSSLLTVMAAKYSMDPNVFAATIRKTCMPANATNEEFGAFMMVAKEYNLNPILKEIHAFPKKGGGIQPVISVDGWISLVNQHPSADGFDFEWTEGKNGDPFSCKCTMYRKDRNHPTIAEEFLSECFRNTEPWKMKRRMLRHRAFIQAARMAFGFTGIMDEDEGSAMLEMRDITPDERPDRAAFISNSAAPPRPAADEGKAGEAVGSSPAGAPADPDPEYEFGVPDALEMGKLAFAEKRPRRAPPEWVGHPQQEALTDAFLQGYDDAESAAKTEEKGKAP